MTKEAFRDYRVANNLHPVTDGKKDADVVLIISRLCKHGKQEINGVGN